VRIEVTLEKSRVLGRKCNEGERREERTWKGYFNLMILSSLPIILLYPFIICVHCHSLDIKYDKYK
jgi:hypothetical protein